MKMEWYHYLLLVVAFAVGAWVYLRGCGSYIVNKERRKKAKERRKAADRRS